MGYQCLLFTLPDAVAGIGVGDFQEVKFFENRANGQSKGFCVITLGSEASMRVVMENLPKKELNGQNPVVTLPTKQALNQFESQQKTRPTPPVPPNSGKPMGMGMSVMGMQNMPPQNMHQQRMMNPNGPMMRGDGMSGPNGMGNRPPMGMNPMNMNQRPMGMPPRGPRPDWNNRPPMGHPGGFNQGQQGMNMGPNGMGPNRPPMGMNPMNMNQRPMGMPPRGPRPDWNNRPPMGHPGGFNQGQQGMNMPPRIPSQMAPQGPAPHVNPAFFNQNNMQGPPMGPMGQMGAPPHFNQQGGPRPQMWPVGGPNKMPVPGFDVPPTNSQPPISEVEFEEIMGRNRTVSSSAIARAVSDAAAGEYASAIETLATAISLIKQSKVANDERCKILITSLQDTLQGIEAKSYNRRDRSDRSRSRERRRRRERSNSRTYRRSRSREHREHRDRGRDE